MKRVSFKILQPLFVTAIMLYGTSCNKTFPENGGLNNEYPNDTASVKAADNKKVLYLIIDGARGSEVDSLSTPSLNSLTRTAVYSWRSVSGINTADTTIVNTWATMFTGVNSHKHGIETSFSTANFNSYPSVVSRLKALKPDIDISAFAASADFSQNITQKADKNETLSGDDKAVASKVADELRNNANADIVIGQFGDVLKAGKAHGFTHRNQQYAKAITTADAYVGKIINALRSRPTYQKEDWLVVVASNNNGSVNYANPADSLSAYDDTRRNSFVIFQNENFKEQYLPYPTSTKGLSQYQDSTLLLTGTGSSGVYASIADPAGELYFTKGKSFTIDFKFKFKNTYTLSGDGYFMNILCTQPGYYSNGNGWAVRYNGSALSFYLSDATGRYANMGFDANGNIRDNEWHSIVITVNWPTDDNQTYVSAFVDGIPSINEAAATFVNFTQQNYPLRIGAVAGASTGKYLDHYVTNVRYWNRALPVSYIRQMFCRVDIPLSSPYINNLILNYKVNEGADSKTIADSSPKHYSSGTIIDPGSKARWDSFSEVSNGICPAPDKNFYKSTPNDIDIPIHIYQWLGIVPQSAWALEGVYWPNTYNSVTLPDRY